MRKMKRVLSFIMACVMLFSSANTGVYATEISEPVVMVEEGTEIIDEEEVSVGGTEIVESTEESETVDIAESVDATEMEDSTESSEEMDSTEIEEATEVVDETTEEPVATEILEEIEEATEIVAEETPEERPDIRLYDDLLDMQVEYIEFDEIEGELYSAAELVEMAENMPSVYSESYSNYWDNYASYYIYNRLSDVEKELWRGMEVLYSSYLTSEEDLNGLTDFVWIPTSGLTSDDIFDLANLFKYSHPQYYYLMSGYSCSTSGTKIALAFRVYDAFMDGTDRMTATTAVKAQLDAWCEEIVLGSTEEEKVKIIHDIICDKVDYNHEALNAGINNVEQYEFTQSAYSVFCTDLTVCAGYTQAFMWLCNAVDIECFGVTSPGHAYNKVKVNDNWYNVDCTWDDRDGVGNRYYAYYLKNDANIADSSHTEEEEWLPYLPSCTLDSGSDYWEAGTLPVITQKVDTPMISIVENESTYTVSIGSTTNGAEIFYTLDGKTPSESNSRSILYNGSFELEEIESIKAIAVCDGYLDSEIAEKSYSLVASGTCGENITWQLDSEGGMLISGSGDMYAYEAITSLPWHSYRDEIKNIVFEGAITSIAINSFCNCENLTMVKLADTITQIGALAFNNTGITQITLPSSLIVIDENAFSNTKLTDIVIPSSVTRINGYALKGCTSLTQLYIPNTVTVIAENALDVATAIIGYVGSAAEEYANTYGNEFINIEDFLVKVTFVTNAEDIEIEPQYYWPGEYVVEPEINRPGYYLYGWYTTEEFYAESLWNFSEGTASEDMTLYAWWANIMYTLLFDANYEGAESIPQLTVVYDEPYGIYGELPTPTRTGYSFEGWYTQAEGGTKITEESIYKVAGSSTLYAHWTPNEYEVTFDAGEGTVDITKMSVTFDSAYGELPVPVKENFLFAGWYTALEGGSLVTEDTIVKTAENHTLYARYELPIVASGTYNGPLGSGEWKLDALGTMTVSGYAGPWYDIAEEYKEATLKLVLEEGITSIDGSAFMNFANVTKVVLPESLTEIGSQAFMGCESLSEINLPNNITTIGEYAFNNCTALQQIALPSGLTEISPYVFAGCRLTSIEIPASVTKIGDSAFFGCCFTTVTVPDTVTEIEGYAFNACKDLETITLPANITYIGEGLFAACEKLSAVIIPTGVTSIGAEAFRECKALAELVIPVNVKTIGAKSFEGCTGLMELVIPVNVEFIGAGAFEGCSGLTEMTIPGNVKTLGEELFFGCTGLSSVIFEDGVEILGARALYNCSNLEYVYFADSMSYGAAIFNDVYCDVHTKLLTAGPKSGDYDVEFGWTKEIPSYAFANLVSLQSCVIPDTVTKIGERAFMSTGLTAIDIPSNVTSIGDAAFIDCNALTQVYVPKTVTSIGTSAFTDTTAIIGFIDSAAYIYAVDNGNEFIDVLDLAIKVEFVTNTDEEIEPQYYFEASFVTEPGDLEKKGYTLEGWYTSAETQDETTKWNFQSDIVSEDIVLYAKWSPNTYKLFYNLNYEGTQTIEGKSVTFDAAYGTLPTISRMGYTFMGWYTQTEGGEQIEEETIYNNDADTIIYAQWSANTYKVTLNPNGGILDVLEVEVAYDSSYGELPVPMREGYDFVGWFTDLNEGQLISADTKVSITEDQTLYAHWKADVSEVTFDATGGVEIEDKLSVTYGEAYGELPVPVREGSGFVCWCLDDGTVITAETIVSTTEDHTLYAKWGYQVAALEVDVPSGEVEKGTRVSITTKTNGVQIYYTTNSEVNLNVSAENGTLEADAILYEDSIEITEAVTIYAIAVKEGYVSSGILTVSYTVKDESQDWGDILPEDQTQFENADKVPEELWVAGISDCDYTGKAITYPDLRVYNHKTLLEEKVDYTVKYKNNTKAGTATVTISGKGNYAGSIVKNFEIRPLDISAATVSDVAVPYNGKVQKATTTVTYLLDGKTITLKKGSDFTYTYPQTDSKDKENYDADAFKEVNEETGYTDYTVIVTGKGNYTGTTTFTQRITKQYVIGKMKLTTIKSQPYDEGKAIEPEIILMNGKEQLTGCKAEEFVEGAEVDFTVRYENNTEVGTATVTITGNEARGYVGTRTTTFKITGTPLNRAKLTGFVSSLPWAETPVMQEDVVFTYTTGSGENKVTKELEVGTDYEVQYQNNDKVGTATVIFTGKGGFTGTVKKTFKITGIPMNKVVAENLTSSVEYECKEMTLSGYVLKYTEGKGEEAQTTTLVEGTDYTVSYKNNHKAGTANIIFTGINGYTGTLKKSFKITQYMFDGGKVSISMPTQFAYTKGGVTPKSEIEVIYTGAEGQVILVEGKDYTLKYANNKAIADKDDTKAPSVTVTGKGSFKGTLSQTFTITGGDLSEVVMTATDISYQNKGGICKPKIVLTDTNGKKLASNTDYDKNIVYTYARDVEVTQVVNKEPVAVMRFEGAAVEKDDIIPVGAEIKATVTGIKNYSGEQSVIFRYVTGDMTKATIKVANQVYTGKPVKPTKEDITVKIGQVFLEKTDYEIVGYSNNEAKGTAKITIRGIGSYGGEKTVTFKINSKSMNYTIAYDKNAEDATGKMKDSVISAGKKLTANSYKRVGYKFVGWNTKADGSGHAYTDKEVFYLKGFMWIFGREITLYAQWELIEN